MGPTTKRLSILLADNDREALSDYADFLATYGYSVLTASTPAEAREILETRHVHLAVFDLRLVNDDDERDRSGLLLAKEATGALPKLILTKFPTYQDARLALRIDSASVPPVVDFLNKHDGIEANAEAIKAALEKHVHVNLDLSIRTDDAGAVTFSGLTALLDPSLSGERLLSAAEEFEDLFRSLFYEKSQLNLSRLLWQRGGRLALKVFAFAEGKSPEPMVVVCGLREHVLSEAARYHEFAPKAPGQGGTVLNKSVETYRYAANAYVLAGTDLESVGTLGEFYHAAAEKNFNAALTNLFQGTLDAWQQGGPTPLEGSSLAELYRARLAPVAAAELEAAFAERVQAIASQVPTLGADIERGQRGLSISFGDEAFVYPDPARALAAKGGAEGSVLLISAPGELSGQSVLTDPQGRVWLTDFADAGPAPALWNYTALEAAVRFDWAETKKIRWLHDFELLLAGSEFNLTSTADLEPPLRKPARAIRLIRQLAARAVGRNYRAYHLSIFWQAVRRILEFDHGRRVTANELARLAHLILALAVLTDRLYGPAGGAADKAARGATGIRIDRENREVWVNDSRVRLGALSYGLLCELYDHAGALCTRRRLIEQVFRETFDESDLSQINRLNAAIRRLREKIEEDPNHPRFLLTEPFGGYRLTPNPTRK